MSSSEVIRAAIVAVLETVPGIGKIHPREKYSRTTKKLAEFYITDEVLAGGFIRRVAFKRVSPDGGYTFVVYTTWDIHFFRGFQEAEDSELDFDALIDAMDRAFVLDQTLGETIDSIVGEEQSALQLVSSQPAMFAGYLTHYARLRLITEHTDSA
ncbi:MAG: hypothetical protein P1V33_03500 [Pseudohongiella nitratireducens]|nr:hypothetical protein [Pseudohongiella nitratireducens]MDF1622520.1 hypothetical protein [Pseudohongiella nitratireducens]